MTFTKETERQFFAFRTDHHRVHMGGKKLVLANFPNELKEKVMKRIAEKDVVMALGQKGVLPGIKIDGKEVTRDNIHEFEKKPEKIVKKETSKKKEVKKRYIEKQIWDMKKKEQVKILREFGLKYKEIPKTEKGRVNRILKLQEK